MSEVDLNFERALTLVLKHEGGFTDDPQDRGGATNFGITQSELGSYLKRLATRDDVKNMSVLVAKDIYKTKYWDQLGLAQEPEIKIAIAAFDQSVVSGVHFVKGLMPIKSLQQFLFRMQLHYIRICKQDSSQLRFLEGWIIRTQELF